MSYDADYCREAVEILGKIDQGQIESMISILLNVREKGGRLSFWASGERLPTVPTRSMIFAKSAGLRPIRRWIMSRS